jgi:carbamate kinase
MTYLSGMQKRYAVIAIGGNAILRKNQIADPATQMANIRRAVDNLVVALDRYSAFALTHGNGPQVGNDLIRSYCAWDSEKLPELGLTDCVANTQGRIGHWIVREMKNHLRFRHHPVACVLTHVYVENNEFTREEYTKYVGPWRPNDERTRGALDERGIVYRSPDGVTDKIRRVVPSPNPYAIEEFGTIAGLLENGVITICCGGGGIPVFDPTRGIQGDRFPGDSFQQSEVVIDKDRASALLAANLLTFFDGAEIELVILMEAKGLYRDARCREEDFISKMTLAELEVFLQGDELDPGSIRPKLEAIHYFLAKGGRRAFLGSLPEYEKVYDPGSAVGTVFVQSEQLGLYD